MKNFIIYYRIDNPAFKALIYAKIVQCTDIYLYMHDYFCHFVLPVYQVNILQTKLNTKTSAYLLKNNGYGDLGDNTFVKVVHYGMH